MAKTKTANDSESDMESPAIARGNVNRDVSRSPNFVSVYSNDVHVQTTPWDVRFTFGEMKVDPPEAGSEPIARVTELCDVRLSPQLAKRVLGILLSQVKTYEDRFGAIPQPPDE